MDAERRRSSGSSRIVNGFLHNLTCTRSTTDHNYDVCKSTQTTNKYKTKRKLPSLARNSGRSLRVKTGARCKPNDDSSKQASQALNLVVEWQYYLNYKAVALVFLSLTTEPPSSV